MDLPGVGPIYSRRHQYCPWADRSRLRRKSNRVLTRIFAIDEEFKDGATGSEKCNLWLNCSYQLTVRVIIIRQ